MMLLSVLCATLGALCIYLSTSHQQFSRRLTAWRTTCRLSALISCVSAVLLAMQHVGLWAGVFTALTAFMLAAVLVPYLDVYRQQHPSRRRSALHVE